MDRNRASATAVRQPRPDDEATDIPLVVDLDGTLTRSDLLIESIFRLLAVNPLMALKLPMWLSRGKAAFKAIIADHVVLDLHMLPLNDTLVEFIQAERARGRKVYLASASDRRYVEALAEHLGFFDGVFASDGKTNLEGAEKARVLSEAFGDRGFDYAANARVDLWVWEKARRAILVDVTAQVRREARQRCEDVFEMSPRCLKTLGRGYAKAMRLHQWLKNLLIFLPLLANHATAPLVWSNAVLAFFSFSLCASSVYLLNDLLDLPNDRQHATKKNRPFAAGRVPLLHGMVLIPTLLLASGAIAVMLPWEFLATLTAYYAITLLYSLSIKRKIVIDVVTLAVLYTVRVVAGAAATGIAVSDWLLAFSMFLFLCLALIKRYSELVERLQSQKPKPAGRGYRTDDTPMVGALAGAAGFISVLVLALYIKSPDVHLLYNRPEALWGIGLLLLYWICRVLMLSHRGEMHDDPVVFAVTDRISQVTVALMAIAALVGSLP